MGLLLPFDGCARLGWDAYLIRTLHASESASVQRPAPAVSSGCQTADSRQRTADKNAICFLDRDDALQVILESIELYASQRDALRNA
jgi:hypothetical protein